MTYMICQLCGEKDSLIDAELFPEIGKQVLGSECLSCSEYQEITVTISTIHIQPLDECGNELT